MLYYERKFRKKGFDSIIGVDEAGRGPLAGPVVAAAVILGNARLTSRIDDSKKLTSRQRDKAFLEITAKTVFGIGVINEQVIDRLNILQATRLAMENAIFSLIARLKNKKKRNIHVLVDGTVMLDIKMPFTNIIRGDAKSKSIASASIVAKVTRDRIMSLYDKVYPQYGFIEHKGYPTQRHKTALRQFGPSLIHRKSFKPSMGIGAESCP